MSHPENLLQKLQGGVPGRSANGHPWGVVLSDGPGPEYDTAEKREKVSQDMQRAAEQQAQSLQMMDNRTPEEVEARAPDRQSSGDVRTRTPADSAQYGEGGKAPEQ